MNILGRFANADFTGKGLPIWHRLLNYAVLSPIILWPFVLIGAIMMFYNPQHIVRTWAFFVIVITYPLWHAGIVLSSNKLYRVNKPLSTLLPLTLIAFYLWLFTNSEFLHMKF